MAAYVAGFVETPVGKIPRVHTTLSLADRLSNCRVRWNIGRMRYRVPPGLYAAGTPDQDSPVLVTANYKMSFDYLRRQLADRSFWILVLDTRGINVWCAAGKGTFGTEELVRQVQLTRLNEVVAHRKLILPQLGATGVAAHMVVKLCGFKVIWGPIRSEDILEFAEAGFKATPEMRRVRFPFRDRLVLVPVEIVMSWKSVLATVIAMLILAGFQNTESPQSQAIVSGLPDAISILLLYLFAASLPPLLLPWLPGLSFAAKGAWVGLILGLGYVAIFGGTPDGFNLSLELIGWMLIITAVTSFKAMNFTGSSTYTSLSGVKKEMRIAVPLQIAGAVVGIGCWIAAPFVSF